MGIVWFYLLVVFTVSIPVALFECWGITHFRVGWGEPLPTDTFWGKPLARKVLWNIVDLRLFTRYHAAMFFVVSPALLTFVTIFLKDRAAYTPAGWLGWTLFIAACALGLMVLEDFLFFVFSTVFGSPYANALTRLLNGEANWHPRWIDFGLFKLPDFYVWMPMVIACLLYAASRFSR